MITKNKLHRGHALKILKWCEDRYGLSKYNEGHVSIEFRKEKYPDEENQDGYYDDITNTIFVNRDTHATLKELVKTIIEEYVHYLQSDEEYQRLAKTYNYYDHPLEKEAKEAAKKDCKICINELKNTYSNFGTL